MLSEVSFKNYWSAGNIKSEWQHFTWDHFENLDLEHLIYQLHPIFYGVFNSFHNIPSLFKDKLISKISHSLLDFLFNNTRCFNS